MSIVHVVLIQWPSGVSPARVERARVLAREFPDRIGGLSIVEGPSVSGEGLERGNDYGMVVTFRDRNALEHYLPHPVHQEFVRVLEEQPPAQVTVFDITGASSAAETPGSTPPG
ncbi:Dabb family protein [Microbacterium sp. ET2]|uniref:Dabb family protein n=1 Tax=Microbacterium albipurpureum TaxID=3050384 RepID=UPI00259D2E06|nr:Dabb family protein [Microbacterium sp. ET2 (Ac-2212)]WJL94319.1 Dabb family protein [Microbacterium sp. ET2 (Ac-2212)]